MQACVLVTAAVPDPKGAKAALAPFYNALDGTNTTSTSGETLRDSLSAQRRRRQRRASAAAAAATYCSCPPTLLQVLRTPAPMLQALWCCMPGSPWC